MKKFIIAALGVALGLASLNASAATTANLPVSLLLFGDCSVATSAPVPFTPILASTSGSVAVTDFTIGTVTVTGCTGGTYFLGADKGAGTQFTGGSRYLWTGGAATGAIPYTLDLYDSVPAKVVTNWGDLNMTSPTTTGGGNGYEMLVATASDVYTVKGNYTVPATPSLAGSYTDTVIVRVQF